MLKIGDVVGGVYPETLNGVTKWRLVEDEIIKIVKSKSIIRYHTKNKFRPLDAEDVDNNTEMVKELNMVFSREVFGLDKFTRKLAEEYVEYMNKREEIGFKI